MTDPRKPTISVEVAERIAKRKKITEKHSPHLEAYHSRGGSYLIASPARWNDKLKPVDLLLVLPDDTVIVLRPTVNPKLVEDVRQALAIEADLNSGAADQRFLDQQANA
jgi:hypothetical protein